MADTVNQARDIVELQSGNKWTGGVITYTFLDFLPKYYEGYNNPKFNEDFFSQASFSPVIKNAVNQVFSEISAVTGLVFQEVQQTTTQVGNIAVGFNDHPSFGVGRTSGQGFVGGDNNVRGDLWLASHFANNPVAPIDVIRHEILHSLGLKHPSISGLEALTSQLTGEGDGGPTFRIDPTGKYTAVSQQDAGDGVPEGGLQLFDVAALQHMYGVNTSTSTGNTTYGDDQNSSLSRETIWDAGGLDTLSAENAVDDFGAILDLRQGRFSTILNDQGAVNEGYIDNISIAYGTEIEKAIGSQFDDEIVGNALSNILEGGAGNDIIGADESSIKTLNDASPIKFTLDNERGPGNGTYDLKQDNASGSIDVLRGGAGEDILIGGASGTTYLEGGDGADTFYGGSGEDIFVVGSSDESQVDVIHNASSEDSIGMLAEFLDFDGLNQFLQSYLDPQFGEELLTPVAGVTAGEENNLAIPLIGGYVGSNSDFYRFHSKWDSDTMSQTVPELSIFPELQFKFTQGGGFTGEIEEYIYSAFTIDYTKDLQRMQSEFDLAGLTFADYNLEENDLLISFELGSAFFQSINDNKRFVIIKDFENGDAGINLIDTPPPVTPGKHIFEYQHKWFDQGSSYIEIPTDVAFNASTPNLTPASDPGDLSGTYNPELLYDNIENGTAGDDVQFGSADSDEIFGFAGDDSIQAFEGNDRLVGGLGADSLQGGAGDDVVVIDEFDIWYSGDDGVDTVIYEGSADFNYALGQGEFENAQFGAGDDTLYGGEVDNYINGGAGADTLFGFGGNDTLVGGDGVDSLQGGEGNDIVYVDINDSWFSGDGGIDTLIHQGGSSFDYALDQGEFENALLGFGDDTIYGGDADNQISGGGGDDTLFGFGGNDTLIGADGADSLQGGEGDDLIIIDENDSWWSGDGGTDTVQYEGSGDFVYSLDQGGFENAVAGNGDDIIYGTSTANSINGGAGNDELFGYEGSDVLTGGAGDDALFGGAGSDVFVFSDNAGDDVVYDFEDGLDLFDLIAVSSINDFNDLQAAAAQVGDNVEIDLGGGSILEIQQASLAIELDATDFLFA